MGRTYTIEEWHRKEIKKNYRRLWLSFRAYIVYKLKFIRKLKRKVHNKEFADKLSHWRDKKTLTVVTDDTVEHFKSHADGKMYSSKKKYRQEIRARGFEEVGNDSGKTIEADNVRAEKQYDDQLNKDIMRTLNE